MNVQEIVAVSIALGWLGLYIAAKFIERHDTLKRTRAEEFEEETFQLN